MTELQPPAKTDLTRFTSGSIAGRAERLPGPLRGLHRVELDGLPAVYAMCAIDALGLPLMAGRDGRITSADPADGAPVEVTVRNGTWSWTPAGTVVVAGRATGCGSECGSFEVMCPNTAFHASPESARAYLASHGGLDAQILDAGTAIEAGRLTFAALLTGPA